MMKMSEEMIEKLMFVRVCKDCRAVKTDMVLWKKKRCPLCGSLTLKFKMEGDTKKSKKDEKVVRFPRKLSPADALQQKVVQMITERTRDFDCPGTVASITKGPVVTEYEFTPDRFTRIKKLKSLNEDLALSLEVDTVSIRRIPSRSAIGISIPNADRKEITFQECLKNVIAHRDDMELPLNMGITSDGSPYVEDLAKYPHLLVAGATGTGKSVFLNNILINLLYIRTPKQLRLVLIDPKTVELFPYKGLPHLLHDPVNTVWGALEILDNITEEMKRRTANLHVLKANNIKELNERLKAEATELKKAAAAAKAPATRATLEAAAQAKLDEMWPYIMVVIDEMAEIILAEKKLFIEKIAGISQMARAAGISIIAATQRPSVDVLPGKVKVNFLARAAFKMPSPQDSKTVLNFKGAETLLGKGDMFVLSPDKTGLQRIHVPNCTRADRDLMLKLSLEHGHENTAPADKLPPINGGKAAVK